MLLIRLRIHSTYFQVWKYIEHFFLIAGMEVHGISFLHLTNNNNTQIVSMKCLKWICLLNHYIQRLRLHAIALTMFNETFKKNFQYKSYSNAFCPFEFISSLMNSHIHVSLLFSDKLQYFRAFPLISIRFRNGRSYFRQLLYIQICFLMV